ncbi:MAG: hybrid sensor histidine kinase/response regulator [Rhizonema sp. PD38]|nr:hybrid sensor histidine kinase/response regulator [Rhizonema sp. PD38]
MLKSLDYLKEKYNAHLSLSQDNKDRILLLSDNDLDESLLNYIQVCTSFWVRHTDSTEVLQIVRKSPLDLMVIFALDLPNWHDLIGNIRSAAIAYFPILLVSDIDSLTLESGLLAGADDLVTKPFAASELKAKIGTLLRMNRRITEASDRSLAQENFVRLLVHDLRVPLYATSQILDSLVEGVYGQELKEISPILRRLHSSTQSSLELVKTLLDTSLYDAGVKKPNFEKIDIQQTLVFIAEQLRSLAMAKNLKMQINLSVSSPTLIVGDPIELQRVFLNLISNAIKFTNFGCVSIGLQNNDKAIIEISDSGMGITAKDLPNIFSRYYCGDRSKGGNVGSGLGLYLAKQIVEAHKGRIEVFSAPGLGSTFIVELPIS